MRRKRRKIACLMLAGILSLSGCTQSKDRNTEAVACPYEEFIVVDVYSNLANYRGIQSGWFGKLIKDKFNMELNIIAQNVEGGGDTLFETRSAAGNLGDLVVFSADDGMLQDMVTAGLLLDMESYIKNAELMRFEPAIRKLNTDITPEGIYAIPSSVSEQSPLDPCETLEPAYGAYIRWDLYKELGYPEMKTMEDLLPVLKQMQMLEPETADGDKTYGFSFFKDWDDNLMTAIKQPCCMYGYDESGFALVKADGSDYQSIIEGNSLYVRMLKFFFKANQMGLVDPESWTQNYSSYEKKYIDGQILFSPWSWSAQPNFNTASNKEQGKGYMIADIGDMQIYSYGCSTDGNAKSVIAIGAGAEDPQRMADFIDWLYSPEGVRANEAGSLSGAAGPEGLCWEYTADGPVLTEYGKRALFENSVEIPAEYGGGTWSGGISQLNYASIHVGDKDEHGYPYLFQMWDSVQQLQETALDKDWREHMQADNAMEYLIQNEKLIVTPGGSFITEPDTTDQTAIRKQCKKVIQQYSWDMVFAEDEVRFYELLLEMQKTVKGLGYDEIYAHDLENAKAIDAQKREIIAEYKK